MADGLKDRLRAAARALLGEPTAGPLGARPTPAPRPAPGAPAPAVRVDGLSNLVVVVLDSCRWDTWQRALPRMKHLGRLGEAERRFAYASWTAPSHYNLLTGLLPHRSPSGVFASEVYKDEYLAYSERLGREVEFADLLPGLWLPGFLRSLGYRTGARVSLPVLNPATGINRDFDSYRLMPSHNDFGAILDDVGFADDRPSFWMLNVGETHYPYALAGEDPGELPHVSGVHGVAKRLGAGQPVAASEAPDFFAEERMGALHQRQVDALVGLDRHLERLYDLVPENTWIIVTADHGELFGEGGYFGHGPIQHEAVFAVPFVEGRLR